MNSKQLRKLIEEKLRLTLAEANPDPNIEEFTVALTNVVTSLQILYQLETETVNEDIKGKIRDLLESLPKIE